MAYSHPEKKESVRAEQLPLASTGEEKKANSTWINFSVSGLHNRLGSKTNMIG